MDTNDRLTPSRPMAPSDIVRELDRKASAAAKSLRAAPHRHPIPESPADADEPEAFDAESGDYKAYGRTGKHSVPTLRLIFKNGSQRPCQYAHLDTHDPDGSEFIPSAPGGRGNIIRLRFAGHSSVVIVTIEGVRLHRLWEQITGHLTPWVHELPAEADFSGGDDPVIRSITMKPVK
jgi:hypothetical protein